MRLSRLLLCPVRSLSRLVRSTLIGQVPSSAKTETLLFKWTSTPHISSILWSIHFILRLTRPNQRLFPSYHATKLCHFDFAFISLLLSTMVAPEPGNAATVSCIICRTNSHSILACPYPQGAQEFAKNVSYAPRASNRSRRHSKSKERTRSPKQHAVSPIIITPEFAGNASSALEAHSPLQLPSKYRHY